VSLFLMPVSLFLTIYTKLFLTFLNYDGNKNIIMMSTTIECCRYRKTRTSHVVV
jgi:hypothetical protein